MYNASGNGNDCCIMLLIVCERHIQYWKELSLLTINEEV